MPDETENLTNKLREIEEQCSHALAEIPTGLTNSRIRHVYTLAKFIRMRLEGRPVGPVESLPEELRTGERPN
jgi:hypothetical protein